MERMWHLHLDWPSEGVLTVYLCYHLCPELTELELPVGDMVLMLLDWMPLVPTWLWKGLQQTKEAMCCVCTYV